MVVMCFVERRCRSQRYTLDPKIAAHWTTTQRPSTSWVFQTHRPYAVLAYHIRQPGITSLRAPKSTNHLGRVIDVLSVAAPHWRHPDTGTLHGRHPTPSTPSVLTAHRSVQRLPGGIRSTRLMNKRTWWHRWQP